MYKSALLFVTIAGFIANNSLAQSEEKGDTCKTIPNTDFRITVLDSTPIPIPTDHFSIRQNSSIWFDGYYYLYADAISWNNPYHPASYNSSIHLFKSKDAENWQYAGEVIGKGIPGEWTANGIATPGACVFKGKIYVAYSVRGNKDGSGHRFIGVSVADSPAGPFRELPELRIIPGGVDYSTDDKVLMLDDPILVSGNAEGTGPGNERLYIYYRRSLNDFSNPENRGAALEYNIRTRYVVDFRGLWSEPHTILTAPKKSVIETADILWLNGRLVAVILGYTQGGMQIWVSSDSRKFVPAEPFLLDSYLDIFMPSACYYLPGLIQDPDGQVRHMTTPGNIDEEGHYTMWVFRVGCN